MLTSAKPHDFVANSIRSSETDEQIETFVLAQLGMPCTSLVQNALLVVKNRAPQARENFYGVKSATNDFTL